MGGVEDANEAKERGNTALKAQNFDEAIAAYELERAAAIIIRYTDAIRLDGNNHVYYSNRSAAHASKKAFTEALCGTLPDRVTLPLFPLACSLPRRPLAEQGLFRGRSRSDAEKCVQMEPSFARGFGRKGAALYGLGRYADAIVAYKRGLKEDGSSDALKKGLEQAESAKQRMDAHHASYRPQSSGGYQPQGPSITEWRPSSSGGATRLAAGTAVLVFATLYVVSAADPMSNDPARYTYHGRAFMAALAGYVFDIQSKWVPCPVSPMDVYKNGVQSGPGQQFAMWAQNLLMGGPAATSFHGLMFCGAFVSNSPVPPALGIIVLVSLHDVLVDLNALIPSVSSRMPDLGVLTGIRAHAPLWCAYAEVATVLFLLVNVALKRDLSVLLQMFLLYQGLSMKFVSAAPSAPTKQVWREVNRQLESSLPGPLKVGYKKVSSMMSQMQQPQ